MDGNILQKPTNKSKIEFAIEPFDNYVEAIALSKDNADEINNHHEVHDPDWESYLSFGKAGALKTLSVRDNGRLVGYCLLLMSTSLHSKEVKVGAIDVLYLAPTHRRFDVFRRFMVFIEKVAKINGVHLMSFGISTKNDIGKLLERFKYTKIEILYKKEL